MNGVFSSRKEQFIHSLQRAISAIASDKFVNQMFQDQHSAIYVPDRICELIRQILSSDREELIFDLYNKVYSFQFFFDEEKIKQIENLGKKYIVLKNNNQNNTPNSNFTFGFGDIPDYDGNTNSNQNDQQTQKKKKEDIIAFYKILDQQMMDLDVEYINDNNRNNNKNKILQAPEIPRIFKDLKRSLKSTQKSITSMQSDFSTMLQKIKKQTLKIYLISSEKVRNEFVEKIKKAKYVITKQSAQIKQLSENNMNNRHDIQSITKLEDNINEMKMKFQKSESSAKNSLETINSLQQQIIQMKNENEKLNEQMKILTSEKIQLNNFLTEKQQKIEYLEQSLLNIENEVPEADQMNKIKAKITNLNDNIRKIQIENDRLQKKSSLNCKTISILMDLTNTVRETDLLTKVDRLYKEKQKICQILNRSVHSDVSKAVESIYQTHEALKSIMNISDETRLISEIQQLKEGKKKFSKYSEKEKIINEISRIVNAQDDEQLMIIVQSLQRIKLIFEKLCLASGVRLNYNSNLPEIVSDFQKDLHTIKDVKNILNVRSSATVKDTLSELIEIRDKASQICDLFHIKNDQQNHITHFSKLVKVSKNLAKMKESYDAIVRSLNSNDTFLYSDFENFDEVKSKRALKNASLFNQYQVTLKNICDVLKIEFQPSPSKKMKLSALSLLAHSVKSLVKIKANYEKVLEMLGINDEKIIDDENEFRLFERARQTIQTLHNSKKNNDSIINLLSSSKEEDSHRRRSEVADKVGQIWKTFCELCSIFKISQPNSFSSLSLPSTLHSLVSHAKSLQESHSRNMSSMNNISICLKRFKQDSKSIDQMSSQFYDNDNNEEDDFRIIESDVIQVLNDLSSIFACFGTNDCYEIKKWKKNFDSQKVGIDQLFQLIGRSTIEGTIEFLSKYFKNINQSSSFLGRLFRMFLLLPAPNLSSSRLNANFDSNSSSSPVLSSVDEIPLPIPKDVQERLIALANQQKFERNQLREAVDKTIEKARSFGLALAIDSSTDDFVSIVDSALNFIIEKVRSEVKFDFESNQIHLEKQLSDSTEMKLKYKTKINELKKTIENLNKKNSEIDKNQSFELQELRSKVAELNDALVNEKKVHAELMEVLGGKRADTQYLRSRLSSNELLLLSKAEKTRKFVEEMRKRKDESQRILSLQKETREAFQKNNFN